MIPVAFAACHDEGLWVRIQKLAERELCGQREYLSWLGREYSRFFCGQEMTNAMEVFNLV